MGRSEALAAARILLALPALWLAPAAGAAPQVAGDHLGEPPPSSLTGTVKWLGADGSTLASPDPSKQVVVHQHPLPGQALGPAGLTLLVVEEVVVPDLAGMTLAAAQRVAGRHGLVVTAYLPDGSVSTQPDAMVEKHGTPTGGPGVKEPGSTTSVGGAVGVILVSPGGFLQTAQDCIMPVLVGAVLAAMATAFVLRRRPRA